MNKNLKIFLLAGFVSYYVFFVLFGLLVEQRTEYSDGYKAFEIALFFGPFVAMVFTGILYLAAFARRALFPVAAVQVLLIGALVAAFFV